MANNRNQSAPPPPKQEYFVLFYSHKCKECDRFNKLLQEYPDLNVCVKKINIHEIQPHQIPKGLRAVPSVMMENRQMCVGAESFRWLQEKIKNYFSGAPIGESNFSVFDGNTDMSKGVNDLDSVFGQQSPPQQQQPRQNQQLGQNYNSSNKPDSQQLPPQLQPIKISGNETKFNNNDYNNVLRSRENDFKMPPR